MLGLNVSLLAAATTQPMFDALKTRVGWTEWGMLLGGIFLGVLVGRVASGVIRGAGRRVEKRGWKVQAAAMDDVAGPLALAILTFGINMGMVPVWNSLMRGEHDPGIDGVHEFYLKVIRLLYILSIGWFLFNLVDVVDVALRKLTARTESKLDDQIVPLVRKTLRIFVVIVFALFTAQNVFGQDITAWLAGLGIAGLAVSLAAQDSIKNLFGSITIFMDRPFGVGDTIKFGGSEGSVEEIGFRSTKVRTPTGSVVSIPNSEVVNGLVENVTEREYIRRLLDVTITYDTPVEKVKEAVEIVRRIFGEEEIKVAWRDNLPPRVHFDEFNVESLRLRVMYWHHPADAWVYAAHAQRFNLRLMEEFERAGIEFAFPTRTLFLAGDPKRKLVVESQEGEKSTG